MGIYHLTNLLDMIGIYHSLGQRDVIGILTDVFNWDITKIKLYDRDRINKVVYVAIWPFSFGKT